MNCSKLRGNYLSVFFLIIIAVISCNNEADKTVSNAVDSSLTQIKDSMPVEADTAITYMLLKKYLPENIPGFKTEGYPDSADRFTGKPTGETGSAFTSGGKLSFIKHLYKQGTAELAVEIIDYKLAADTYKGLFRMYDMDHVQETDQLVSAFIDTGLPGVKAKQVYHKEENKTTVYVFVCERFVVNVQVINFKDRKQAAETLKLIRLNELIQDYCGQ